MTCLVLLTEFILVSYVILNVIFVFVILFLPSLTLLKFWVFFSKKKSFYFVDLDKLGGLVVLIHELNHIDPDVRKVAAWILGKASQNNPIVQKQVLSYTECNYFYRSLCRICLHLYSYCQVLELGALAKLVTMAKSDFVEEAIKALYAISSLVRNNLFGQELFYAEAGETMLQVIY